MRTLPQLTRAASCALYVATVGCSSSALDFGPWRHSNLPSVRTPSAASVTGTAGVPKSLEPFFTNGLMSLLPRDLARNGRHLRAPNVSRPTSGSKDILWVSGFGFPAQINRYLVPNRNNQPPTCQTPGLTGVNGIDVDAKGNLWVPVGNSPGTGYVQQYTCKGAQGLNIPITRGQPADVAIDSKGNIYVGRIINYIGQGSNIIPKTGTVVIFNAQGKFLGNLRDQSFNPIAPPKQGYANQLIGVSVDSHDNCFVSHYDKSGAGEIVEFPGCKPSSHGTILAGPHPWAPGKVQFDASGNLLITDFSFAYYYRIDYLAVYAPPFNDPPTKVIPLFGAAVSCPLSSDQKYLYCGNVYNGSVDVYSYLNGAYQYSFMNGMNNGALGIALAPGSSS